MQLGYVKKNPLPCLSYGEEDMLDDEEHRQSGEGVGTATVWLEEEE